MQKPATVYTLGSCNFRVRRHELGSDTITVETKGLRQVVIHHPGYSEVVAHLLTREQAEKFCEEVRAEHADKQMLVAHISYKKEVLHKNPPVPAGGAAAQNEGGAV